jgi:hypothetical protein
MMHGQQNFKYPVLLYERQDQPIYVKINEQGSLINPMNCSTHMKGTGGSGQAPVKDGIGR